MTFPQNHKFGLPLRPNLDSTSVPVIIFVLLYLLVLFFKKSTTFWFFFLEKELDPYLVMLLHSR